MSPRLKFLFALAACAAAIALVAAALFGLAWSGLAPDLRAAAAAALIENAGALFIVAALLLAALGIALHALFRAYVVRPLGLAEETRLILGANPRHRIESSAPREIAELASAINALAARCEALQADIDARVTAAKRDLETERELLAALMADLSESVLVFNAAGTITLYNERARQLFDRAANGPAVHAAEWIGLGRSIFSAIDREVVVHAIEQLEHRRREGEAQPITEFVTSTRGGKLIRGRLRAVGRAGAQATPAMPAYVLVLHDVKSEVEHGATRERLLRSLTEETRASLASIRAAAEAIMHYPGMTPSQQERFLRAIHDESEKLGRRLNTSYSAEASQGAAEWPLAAMLGRDLMQALRRSMEARLACSVRAQPSTEPVWVSVDSFLLVEAVCDLARRLQRAERAAEFELALAPSGPRVELRLTWTGDPLRVEQVLQYENAPIAIPGHLDPMSFREIVARHGGESWYQRETPERHAFRVLLPASKSEPARAPGVEAGSRPVFYDFDLFHQPGQTAEIEQRALGELTYTVFDTETTGLEPSRGDEIVAIAAVRIVNQRLLYAEAFDQLVNPRREMSAAAVRVHGITPEMLVGQPTIEDVLPRFHRYCEHSVLVAHNAAFDMRFLQLKEPSTGVAFTHPLLDTLLLSAVIHPHQTDHSLEAIAARLGVSVIGRHTALGDAIVTAEIFLKFIPLLRERGIVTFREAHEAQRRTAYAQLRY